jgi:hypothetical protein
LETNETLTSLFFSGLTESSNVVFSIFAATLMANKSMKRLALHFGDEVEQNPPCITLFLTALKTKNAVLEELSIVMNCLWTDDMIDDLRDCFENNRTLKRLSLTGLMDDTLCLRLIPFLLVNKTMTHLTIGRDDWFSFMKGATMVQIMAALENNVSLSCLEMCISLHYNFRDFFDDCCSAIVGLKKNVTFRCLDLTCQSKPPRGTADLGIERIGVAMIENYGIEELSIRSPGTFGTSESYNEEHRLFVLDTSKDLLGVILRLNRAGRRYIINDAGSRKKGVDVLIQVSDDLACLCFHLRENPLLCDLGRGV